MTFLKHPYFFLHKQDMDPPVPVTSALCFKQVFDPLFQLFILVACKKALALVKKLLRLIVIHSSRSFRGWSFFLKGPIKSLFPIGKLFLTDARAFF